jgi:peptide/nickel transport system substrate-binding protein
MHRCALFFLGAAVILAACSRPAPTAPTASTAGAGSGGTLIIGMTAGDVPQLDTVATSSEGYEGYRFVGFQLYDGLTRFDLKQGTEVPKVLPDLAESWEVSTDATQWTFKLRKGVTFHDGTPWNAGAAIYNFDRYSNQSSPRYNAALAARAGTTALSIKSYTKVDDYTLTMVTDPDAHLPSDLTTLFMGSPAAIEKGGADGLMNNPVGTGPFKFVSVTRGQRLVLAPNAAYWAGAPKLDQLILRPIPDPTTRGAALRSKEVNWIEYPNPDSIQQLQSNGFSVITNVYDHIWPWVFDTSQKPWDDIRTRQAANFAINREAMVKDLLKGTADPAYQLAPRGNLAYTKDNDYYSYNPDKAKELLAAAGYANGFTATVSYPTSGSGNMVPVPMNEELQRDLGAVGIKVELKPIEWSAMLGQIFTGEIPDNASAVNISLSFLQESSWLWFFTTKGPFNVGHYQNPQVDALITQAQSTVDDTARYKLYSQASDLISKDAAWLYVVDDRNPRALASSVHGFVEPQSWFVDLTNVWVDK